MQRNSRLNPQQKSAVRSIDGPVLVLAGAGSGKTRVITHKIAYLIDECGVQPQHIAAVTFTNKAAREMKERVSGLMNGSKPRGLTVSTFHTWGLNILRTELAHLRLREGFTIMDSEDSLAILMELAGQQTTAAKDIVKQAQHCISNWKSDLVQAHQAESIAADDVQRQAAKLYPQYEEALRAYNAVDFDDLITLPVNMFLNHPERLQHWQQKIRYLLVDEYQDTNASQYQLVKMLMGKLGNLTAVGDDDQSIYAWRGAKPDNLNQLKSDFPRLNVIKLEQNYRSTGRILKSANALIANNPHLFEKNLWSDLGHGDRIRVIQARDGEHEATTVATSLISHKFKHGTEFRDYAILYRGNHQSRAFETALRELSVPYHISGGQSFFSYTEVKDIMAYLRLIVNPDDNAAFVRIINTPRRQIGPTTLSKLSSYADERRVSLFTACFELGLEQVLPTKAIDNLQKFGDWINRLADQATRGDTIATVRQMIDECDYATWLQDIHDSEAAAERRMGNVYELIAWIERIVDKSGEEKTLAEAITQICLLDLLERNEEESEPNAVQLMTLHAAKGLEFPYVYLVGLEEGTLPHHSSIENDDVEEERRLAYVGITRAQRQLTLSLARQRKKYGELVDSEPSRFIAELPQDDLEWIGGKDQQISEEERKERGAAHIANLRNILNS